MTEGKKISGINLEWSQLVWGVTVVFILGGMWNNLNTLNTTVTKMSEQLIAFKIILANGSEGYYSKKEIDTKFFELKEELRNHVR